MKTAITLITILFFNAGAFAQVPKAYIKSDQKLVVNGQEYKRRFWSLNYDTDTAFSDNSVAQEYFEKHHHYGRLSTGMFWGGVGIGLAYLAATPKDNFREGIYWGIFGAGIIVSSIYRNSSEVNLTKAINVYNGVSVDLAQNTRKRFDIPKDGFQISVLNFKF